MPEKGDASIADALKTFNAFDTEVGLLGYPDSGRVAEIHDECDDVAARLPARRWNLRLRNADQGTGRKGHAASFYETTTRLVDMRLPAGTPTPRALLGWYGRHPDGVRAV